MDKKEFEQLITENSEGFWQLISGNFGFALNANDFFSYSTADMVLLDDQDLPWALPIIEKYGFEGEKAVMSYIAKTRPIKPHINEDFEAALKEIQRINPTVQSEH